MFILRFLKCISFSFLGCNSVEDAWVCLRVRADCCLGDGLYFHLRRENVAHHEALIWNHEELFFVNSLLGQKAAWGFFIPATFFPGNLFLCPPALRAAGEPCCWPRMCSDSGLNWFCPGVCSEPPAFSPHPHNGNFSNYVGNGIGTSCSAPLPLKSLGLACPSGHP